MIYTKGDRVKFRGGYCRIYTNLTATIIDVNEYNGKYDIEFDVNVRGSTCNGKCKYGYGDTISQDYLERYTYKV